MGGGTANKGVYKTDDAEGMCDTTLEPDPRYSGCCSNICRPGRVLRDVIVGFFVVLAIAVVVAVIFAICFYLVPANKESDTVYELEEGAFVGGPIEDEVDLNTIHEVEFTDITRYDVAPDPKLGNIREDQTGHDEHHHVGPTPYPEPGPSSEPEAEFEPKPEPEPESEPKPEPDPESEPQPESEPEPDHMHEGDIGHDHTHTEGDVVHEHTHEGDAGHDNVHTEGEDHEHMHQDGDTGHEHKHQEGHMHMHEEEHTEGTSGHEHVHTGDNTHEHVHLEGDMGHEHTHKEGEMGHEHMHPAGEMGHDHIHPEIMGPGHPEEEMRHDHMHPKGEIGHDHLQHEGEIGHDHMHPEGEMGHDHLHPEGEMGHDHKHLEGEMSHNHTHPKGENNDHIHSEGEMEHEHTLDEHVMIPEEREGHNLEGPVQQEFAPSATTINDEPVEVASTPFLESLSPVLPTISSNASSTTNIETIAPEAISDATSSMPTTLDEMHEEGGLPPLFASLGPHPDTFRNFSEIIPEETPTETSENKQAEDTLTFPEENLEEEEPTTLPESQPEFYSITTEEEALPTDIPVEVSLGTCRPRQLEMCSNFSYSQTALPNWANDQSEKELYESSLPFFRDVIVRSGCSLRAQEYACAILEPPCTADGKILPPCRTFCRSVASTCQEFIISRISLSDVFNCEQFPDSTDPTVCFDMTYEPCVGLEHRCGDGRCVAKRLVCDGLSDCLDHSDEAACPGQIPEITSAATPSTPIEPQTVSPTDADTAATTVTEDMMDEMTTDVLTEEATSIPEEPVTTPPSECPELQCLDGTCLSLLQLNNGVHDCPDGTDEQDFGEIFQ